MAFRLASALELKYALMDQVTSIASQCPSATAKLPELIWHCSVPISIFSNGTKTNQSRITIALRLHPLRGRPSRTS